MDRAMSPGPVMTMSTPGTEQMASRFGRAASSSTRGMASTSSFIFVKYSTWVCVIPELLARERPNPPRIPAGGYFMAATIAVVSSRVVRDPSRVKSA